MRRAAELGAVGLLALVVVGGAVGQPVLLSYVVTDSMEPTLSPGDGFVAVPSALTDEPEEGDVVVYRAQAGKHAGDLVTHRVVDETARGYVTKGDANPFTDQGAGEAPVTDDRIVAEALQIDGTVIVVPGLGTAVMGAGDAATAAAEGLGVDTGTGGGVGLLVFGVGAVLYGLTLSRSGERGRKRERARKRDEVVTAEQVVLGIALLVVLPATATMVAPAGSHSFAVVSSTTDSPRGTAVPAGTEANRTMELQNSGLLPVTVFLDPVTGGAVPAEQRYRVAPGEHVDATVRVSAPEETGYYVRSVRESRYLQMLPTPVIAALHGVHPWLPVLAIDAVLAGGAGLLSLAVLGRTQIRMRSRSRRTER